MAEDEKLTPEQIENWRKILVRRLGPYALIMPVEKIQAIRDKMQRQAGEIGRAREEDR